MVDMNGCRGSDYMSGPFATNGAGPQMMLARRYIVCYGAGMHQSGPGGFSMAAPPSPPPCVTQVMSTEFVAIILYELQN